MIKNIIFDFDGVILDSIPVKTEAFRNLFKAFPTDKVNELIEYHICNGGQSRYLKIEYFFNEILGKAINKKEILAYAENYSLLTKEELSKKKYFIEETLEFIQKNYKKYAMHIASGASEDDLYYICNKLDLNEYFISINGSPMLKSLIIEDILLNYKYKKEETVLVGDSFNDFEAAKNNKIIFYGFNNKELKSLNNTVYLEKINDIEKNL